MHPTYEILVYFSTETDTFPVTIKVPVGELIRVVNLTEDEFTQQKSKLTGMTESSVTCDLPSSLVGNVNSICEKVLEVCNMNKSPSPSIGADTEVLR